MQARDLQNRPDPFTGRWHKRRPEPGLVLLGLVLRMFVVSLIVVFVFVLSLGCSYICVASVGRLIR